MAYQARRKKAYEEEFQLAEADGTVVYTLRVALDADSMVKKLNEKHVALVRALQDVQNVKKADSQEALSEGLEVLGRAVMDLLEAVFGAKDAEIIVNFYDGRYLEMCREVVPFITDIVIPEIRKTAHGNKKAVLSRYKRQRQSLFKRK